MSIWLLANTVGVLAPETRVTDASNVKVPEAESRGIDVIRGGPRSLKWRQSGVSARRIWYVNKWRDFKADFCVWVGARHRAGTIYNIRRSNGDYSNMVTVKSGVVNGPYSGMAGEDLVFQFPEESAAMFGLETGGGVEMRQLYFGKSLEFERVPPQSVVQFQPVPVWAPAVRHAGNYYKLHATSQITFVVDDDLLVSYQRLPKDDPVFLWDPSGDHIRHRLWHCLVSQEQVVRLDDNLNTLTLDVNILKHGDG